MVGGEVDERIEEQGLQEVIAAVGEESVGLFCKQVVEVTGAFGREDTWFTTDF